VQIHVWNVLNGRLERQAFAYPNDEGVFEKRIDLLLRALPEMKKMSVSGVLLASVLACRNKKEKKFRQTCLMPYSMFCVPYLSVCNRKTMYKSTPI
jgi:hypothetical protein